MMERSYRQKVRAAGLVSFRMAVKETDLWVSADRHLERETRDLVFGCRHALETYVEGHPEFLTTLSALPADPLAPPMVREMIARTGPLGVGPMASVAGAIAQWVATGLLRSCDRVIVENGGDIFMKVDRDVTVALYAGASPLSEKIGLRITAGRMPLGICCSSGTVGHSLSRGHADAVCLLSPSAVLADGAATALGNRIRTERDLRECSDWARGIEGITGGLVVMGRSMATWGEVELVSL